jgi:hypothetical protein
VAAAPSGAWNVAGNKAVNTPIWPDPQPRTMKHPWGLSDAERQIESALAASTMVAQIATLGR